MRVKLGKALWGAVLLLALAVTASAQTNTATGRTFTTNRQRLTVITHDGSTTTLNQNGDAVTQTLAGGGVGANAGSSSSMPGLGLGGQTAGSPGGWNGNLLYLVGKNIQFTIFGNLGRTTNERVWIGMTDQTLATMGGSDNPAGNYAAFRYSTGAGDTHFQCVTKDNSTQTVTDSGISPSAADMRLAIQFDDANSQILFYIAGALVCTNNTHLPAANTVVRWVETLNPSVNNTNANISLMQVYVLEDSY